MKYRIFSLLYFLLFVAFLAQAQYPIEGKLRSVQTGDEQFDMELIIEWSQTLSEKWKLEHLPALEAYPIYTGYALKGENGSASQYQLLVSFPFRAAYAFQLNEIQTNRIEIKDFDSGKRLIATSSTRGSDQLVTPLFEGQRFLLTFPAGSETMAVLEKVFVREISSGDARDLGFEGALECEENVACLENSPWELQSRSVVRIRMVMEEGIGWCTGSLMNNTAKDGKPYILSANHCQLNFIPIYENWRFDFGYESNTCANPDIEPGLQSLTGCMLKAKGQDSDFLLLELLDSIPVEYNVYWNGWDRRDTYEPDTVALIHHPSADIKKISIDYDPTKIFQFNIFWDEGITTPSKHHFKSFFDMGTHEGGSSGAPLFDQQGFVVGQLHGGRADCEENFGYSGRFHKSWDSGSHESEILAHWLDPINTGQDTLHGMLHPDLGSTFSVSGVIRDMKGIPMRNILIKVEGDVTKEIYTDTLGKFGIPVVSRSSSITLKPRKNTKVGNGVTPIDLVLIQKHLLNIQPFTSSHALIAADVSGNDKVTGTDLILIQKLLLGINSSFPGRQSWTFDPVSIPLENITEPTVEIEITAIKLGDVNGTADNQQ